MTKEQFNSCGLKLNNHVEVIKNPDREKFDLGFSIEGHIIDLSQNQVCVTTERTTALVRFDISVIQIIVVYREENFARIYLN